MEPYTELEMELFRIIYNLYSLIDGDAKYSKSWEIEEVENTLIYHDFLDHYLQPTERVDELV